MWQHPLNHSYTSSYGVPKALFSTLYFDHVHHPSQSLISSLSLDHHLYADNNLLFFAFHLLNFDSSISYLQNALRQISSWVTANLLTLNSSKNEFLLIGFKNQLAQIHNSSLDTSHSARNLGFIFDEHLTLISDQIKSLCPKPATITFVSFGVSALPRFLNCLCTIATSIGHSKLDYCNSLYYILPKSQLSLLQQTQNSLAPLKFLSPAISRPSYALSTGSESINVSNTSSSLLPTNFSQLPNLHAFITSPLFNVLV